MKTEQIHILSVKQPWADWIIHGTKTVENRTWKNAPKYRGRLYIHASLKKDTEAMIPEGVDEWELGQAMERSVARFPDRTVPTDVRGAIIGYVDLKDVVEGNPFGIKSSSNPWFFGPLGLILDLPYALPEPVALRGKLGIFQQSYKILFPEGRAKEPDLSPALFWQARTYPIRWYGMVPKVVATDRAVYGRSQATGEPCHTEPGGEYRAYVNSLGDVSALLPSGDYIELRPGGFRVLTWV